MIAFNLLLGFLLLFAGRNLFWLCVAVLGFLLGVQCATSLGFNNGLMSLIAAIGLGLIGGVLAVCFEWVAVVFGVGFLGGGYLAMSLWPPTSASSFVWPVFVIGGILGLCLMIVTFDLTLILISSLLGATLIVNNFQGSTSLHEFIFLASALSGILVQYLILKESNTREHSMRST